MQTVLKRAFLNHRRQKVNRTDPSWNLKILGATVTKIFEILKVEGSRAEFLDFDIFSSVCKKKFSPIQPTVQKIFEDQLVTDYRQQTDNRQTDIFELTLIHMGFFFFCVWEGENKWGEIYTSLLATQVRFAHLLCSQGDKHNKRQI